jgi:hypothetical protein
MVMMLSSMTLSGKALAEARAFCTALGVDVDAIFVAEKLARLLLIGEAVEVLVAPDERRRGFFRVADTTPPIEATVWAAHSEKHIACASGDHFTGVNSFKMFHIASSGAAHRKGIIRNLV